MIIQKRAGAAFLTTSLLFTTMAPAVIAASKQKVGKINLTIDSNICTGCGGGDTGVTPTDGNTSLYYVDSRKVTNGDRDSWTKSKPPEVTITLGVRDEEEYYFSSSSSSIFEPTLDSPSKYRFNKIKFVDAKRRDNNTTLILTIQLVFGKDTGTSATTAPASLQWDGEHMGISPWDIISSSKYYQVQLVKDGSKIGEIKDTYDTFYDSSKQITTPGIYKFKARSVRSNNSAKSSWATPGSWAISDGDVLALGNAPAAVPAADNGSWQTSEDGIRWWWCNGDGSHLTFAQGEIDGKWYYLNVDGRMTTGWVGVGGRSYYLDPATRAMVTNAGTPDNYQASESDE